MIYEDFKHMLRKLTWKICAKMPTPHSQSTVHYGNDDKCEMQWWYISPFVPNALFLYPLKKPEKSNIFWCF